MKTIQFQGPFSQGQTLQLDALTDSYNYVKIGIENLYTDLAEVDGNLSTSFSVNGVSFCGNKNGILEWDNLQDSNIIIKIKKDLNAYTLINVSLGVAEE